jgi:DNA-binding transcriptional LysR family regulator
VDLRQLNHLIALAEEGRFILAAERVHLSQAAFSRSIQALEARLGLRLFDRGPRGARLTAAGQAVLARARQQVFVERCFQRDVALLRNGEIGELSFGAGPIPAATVVPTLLVALQRASPGVVTRMRSGNYASLLDLLHGEAIDFFIADPRLMTPDPRLELMPLGQVHGGVYCRPRHALARQRAVSREQLLGAGIGMVSVPPVLRAMVAQSFGLGPTEQLTVALECDDLPTLMRVAHDTDLLALLPHVFVNQSGQTLRSLAVEGVAQPLFADLQAFWLRGRSLSPAARRALELAGTLMQEWNGTAATTGAPVRARTKVG